MTEARRVMSEPSSICKDGTDEGSQNVECRWSTLQTKRSNHKEGRPGGRPCSRTTQQSPSTGGNEIGREKKPKKHHNRHPGPSIQEHLVYFFIAGAVRAPRL